MRLGVSPVSGQAIPFDRLFEILRNAPSFVVHEAKTELRLGVSLLRQFQKFASSRDVIALSKARFAAARSPKACMGIQPTRQNRSVRSFIVPLVAPIGAEPASNRARRAQPFTQIVHRKGGRFSGIL